MANTYDAEAVPAAAEGDPATSAQDEGAGKLSQQQANYRMGGPLVNCGLCANFTGSAGSNAYQCTKVAGEISPYGLSAEYTRQDNPFLAGTQASFEEGSEEEQTEGPETPAADPSTSAQGRLQIGNRSY